MEKPDEKLSVMLAKAIGKNVLVGAVTGAVASIGGIAMLTVGHYIAMQKEKRSSKKN